MDSLMFPWLAEIGLVSYRGFKNYKRPPLPSEVVSTFVVFGMFTIVGVAKPRIASALGWGIVVATALNVFNTSATSPSNVIGSPKTGDKKNVTGN